MITWTDFEQTWLPHLGWARNRPPTFASVYRQNAEINNRGLLRGSATVIQHGLNAQATIASSNDTARAEIEESRDANDQAAEDAGLVADEDVGWRTISAASGPAAVLNREDTLVIEKHKVDKYAEVQMHSKTQDEETKRHEQSEMTTRTQAEQLTKRTEAIEHAREVVATAAATQAGHVAAQKKHELDLERLKRGHATSDTDESDDGDDQGSMHRRAPQKKMRGAPRPRRTTAAPQQPRPRAGPSAITRDAYTTDHMLQYLRRKFPGRTDEIWDSEIVTQFQADQDNPYMGFLPDQLLEQRRWLTFELEELLREQKLQRSTWRGRKAYVFV